MYKHILIPTDGSPPSAKAIQEGVAPAKFLGATVSLRQRRRVCSALCTL